MKLHPIMAVGLLGVLAGCMPAKYIPSVVQPEDTRRSCEELATQIGVSQSNILQAEKDKGFGVSYIFILPAIVNTTRAYEMIDASEDRIRYLKTVRNARGCGPMPAFTQLPPPTSQVNGY